MVELNYPPGIDQRETRDLTFEELLMVFPPGSLTIEDLRDYRQARDIEDSKLTKKTVSNPTPNMTTRDNFMAQKLNPITRKLFIDRIKSTAANHREANRDNTSNTH